MPLVALAGPSIDRQTDCGAGPGAVADTAAPILASRSRPGPRAAGIRRPQVAAAPVAPAAAARGRDTAVALRTVPVCGCDIVDRHDLPPVYIGSDSAVIGEQRDVGDPASVPSYCVTTSHKAYT